jgi:uncharacterized membrane protein YhhN
MFDAFGRAAIRFAITYIRRRYRRQIRVAAAIAATAVAVGAFLLARRVPEG